MDRFTEAAEVEVAAENNLPQEDERAPHRRPSERDVHRHAVVGVAAGKGSARFGHCEGLIFEDLLKRDAEGDVGGQLKQSPPAER